jgi:hypothetical protein
MTIAGFYYPVPQHWKMFATLYDLLSLRGENLLELISQSSAPKYVYHITFKDSALMVPCSGACTRKLNIHSYPSDRSSVILSFAEHSNFRRRPNHWSNGMFTCIHTRLYPTWSAILLPHLLQLMEGLNVLVLISTQLHLIIASQVIHVQHLSTD